MQHINLSSKNRYSEDNVILRAHTSHPYTGRLNLERLHFRFSAAKIVSWLVPLTTFENSSPELVLTHLFLYHHWSFATLKTFQTSFLRKQFQALQTPTKLEDVNLAETSRNIIFCENIMFSWLYQMRYYRLAGKRCLYNLSKSDQLDHRKRFGYFQNLVYTQIRSILFCPLGSVLYSKVTFVVQTTPSEQRIQYYVLDLTGKNICLLHYSCFLEPVAFGC